MEAYAVLRSKGWKGQVVRRHAGPRGISLVDYCPHLHRTEAAALACAKRMIRELKFDGEPHSSTIPHPSS